jgi:hypothetical protein
MADGLTTLGHGGNHHAVALDLHRRFAGSPVKDDADRPGGGTVVVTA